MTTTTVKTQRSVFNRKSMRNAAASLLLLAAGGALTGQAYAYDMQANIIYAHASGGIYAMDRVGDLFTLNEASGFASAVARGVLPGVTGMDTSPVMISAIDTGSTAVSGSDEAGGGSLSAYGLLLMLMVAVLRRFS